MISTMRAMWVVTGLLTVCSICTDHWACTQPYISMCEAARYASRTALAKAAGRQARTSALFLKFHGLRALTKVNFQTMRPYTKVDDMINAATLLGNAQAESQQPVASSQSGKKRNHESAIPGKSNKKAYTNLGGSPHAKTDKHVDLMNSTTQPEIVPDLEHELPESGFDSVALPGTVFNETELLKLQ